MKTKRIIAFILAFILTVIITYLITTRVQKNSHLQGCNPDWPQSYSNIPLEFQPCK